MKIGDSYEVSKTVTEQMTAAAAGSGGLQVFGTPFLLAMMENAAFECMQRELPAGKSSVGTAASLTHTAPTPLGMTVFVRAEVTGVSAGGKLIDFCVTARDEVGPIGEGSHQRAVIDIARFTEKCNAKRGEQA